MVQQSSAEVCRELFDRWVKEKCDSLIKAGEGARVNILMERYELQYPMWQRAFLEGLNHMNNIYQPSVSMMMAKIEVLKKAGVI